MNIVCFKYLGKCNIMLNASSEIELFYCFMDNLKKNKETILNNLRIK